MVRKVVTKELEEVKRERNEALAQVAVLCNPLKLARLFHETYERLAPLYGYETREESAVPWESVPEQNRALMEATCQEIVATVPTEARTLLDRLQRAVWTIRELAPTVHDTNCEWQSVFDDVHKGCPKYVADETIAAWEEGTVPSDDD